MGKEPKTYASLTKYDIFRARFSLSRVLIIICLDLGSSADEIKEENVDSLNLFHRDLTTPVGHANLQRGGEKMNCVVIFGHYLTSKIRNV